MQRIVFTDEKKPGLGVFEYNDYSMMKFQAKHLRFPYSKSAFPLLFFLIIYLSFSFLTYKDYGPNPDEEDVFIRGSSLFFHLCKGDVIPLITRVVPENQTWDIIIDAPLFYSHFHGMLQRIFLGPAAHLQPSLLHLFNMLFSTILFVAAYFLLFRAYQHPWLGLLGPLSLAFYPKVLGSIPSDPKDVPFAIFYLVSLNILYLYFKSEKPDPIYYGLLLGSIGGLTVCYRLLGLTLLPFFLLHAFWSSWNRRSSDGFSANRIGLHLKTLVIATLAAFCLLAIFWPYFGSSPLRHFSILLRFTNHLTGGLNLYQGDLFHRHQLPWHYLPVWILITLPIPHMLGIASSTILALKRSKTGLPMFLLSAILLNTVFLIMIRPGFIDGSRHFTFLLVLCSILAAAGYIEVLLFFPRFRIGAQIALVTGVFLVFLQVPPLYPYHYVYVNELFGGLKGVSGRYETDYWSLASKEAKLWLNSHLEGQKGRFRYSSNTYIPFQTESWHQENLSFVDTGSPCDYHLCSTRNNDHIRFLDQYTVIHRVERQGIPLFYVFRLNPKAP